MSVADNQDFGILDRAHSRQNEKIWGNYSAPYCHAKFDIAVGIGIGIEIGSEAM
ncbi:hypothetical protein [Desulfonatronum parangueonense]